MLRVCPLVPVFFLRFLVVVLFKAGLGAGQHVLFIFDQFLNCRPRYARQVAKQPIEPSPSCPESMSFMGQRMSSGSTARSMRISCHRTHHHLTLEISAASTTFASTGRHSCPESSNSSLSSTSATSLSTL